MRYLPRKSLYLTLILFASSIGLSVGMESAAVAQAVAPVARSAGTATPNLLALSRLAFNSGSDMHSLRLTGSVTKTLGSSVTSGTIEMTIDSSGADSVTTSFDSNIATEQRDSLVLARSCTRTDTGGEHTMSIAACWLPVGWVLPHLILQSATMPTVVAVSDAGITASHGVEVRRINLTTQFVGGPKNLLAEIGRWDKVSMDLAVDSHRVLSIGYTQTPDNGSSIPIHMEVRYSDYRTVDGLTLPYRIDRFINGARDLSISVTTIQSN